MSRLKSVFAPATWSVSVVTLLGMMLVLSGCGGGSTTSPTSPAALSITSSPALPSGQVGTAYTATVSATGGMAPYTWSISSGTLPAGLTLGAGGVISGMPTAAASAVSLGVTVTDKDSPAQAATLMVTLTIAAASNPTVLAITTKTLPAGAVGTPYSLSLTAIGGAAPYTWSVTTGTLPAGLSLNGSTGVISGTPTTAVSNYAFTVSVSDSANPATSAATALTLTIAGSGSSGPMALTTVTTALPSGVTGSAYAATLGASGGTAPYSWALTSGSLPTGLLLDPTTGAIAGVPTAVAANVPLSFTVTDAGSPAHTAVVALNLTVTQGLAITTSSLPAGAVGTPYSASLAAIGGMSPYTWSTAPAVLPAGLALNAQTGEITGTPTAAVSSEPITFSVTDSASPVATTSAVLTVTIAASGSGGPTTLTTSTTSLPNGTVGTTYSATLSASGGAAPYTWAVTRGALPAGLTLMASTGAISGIPTAAASAQSVGFTVTDSAAQTASTGALTLTINPAPVVVTTTTLPSGTVGTAYNATLTASGGTPAYSWAVTAGTLPAGLTLATNGVISGTPTTAVNNSSVTFKATDSANPAGFGSATLTITIAATVTPVSITTTSLPNGMVGATYLANLAATGGTTPYMWSITGGTLPAGLTLNPATGAIAGTPSAAVTSTSITFMITDSSAQVSSRAIALTITAAAGTTLAITTTSLPGGTVNSPYSTTLAASGGTAPYTWALTSGSLPNGLAFNQSTGALSGTPTAAATATPLGFTVTDHSGSTDTASLTLTIAAAGNTTVNVTPKRAGLTVTQSLTLTATTSNASAVNWSINSSSGSFSAGSTASGAATTLTAPTTAGVYTVKATSATDGTSSASITVAVTDLGGVYTYHNDQNRDGANTREYALTTANVNTTTFGKLFSCSLDGAVYAQPLWVANLTINGNKHNVVFVATEHDGLYAIDADVAPCDVLWHVSLIDTAHGAAAGETSVPWNLLGSHLGDIQPEVGVTGTPVIDPGSHILYVVSKSTDSGQTTFPQRLHAINLFTGAEMAGAPVTVAGTYPGTAEGSSTTTFNTKMELQRAGLALVNGVVYATWSGHEDTPPYYGWMMGYAYTGGGFTQKSVFNDDPNAHYGGIWMSGGAPAADGNGNLYAITGNGAFDVNTGGPDYGDSMLQLTPSGTNANGIAVTNYFTPSDQQNDQQNDNDFGAGGAAILADLPTNAPVSHLIMGGGKDGALYVLNRDTLGAYGDNTAWQRITFSHGIFSTGAFWNDNFYLRGSNGPLETYALNLSTALFSPGPVSTSGYGRFGATPSVSASGSTNGIVWDINAAAYCTAQSTSACGPAVLHAFDATNISTQLWTSSDAANSADVAGYAVKFILPTVANGKVYVGTRGNNSNGTSTSMTIPGELDVYGLKPN